MILISHLVIIPRRLATRQAKTTPIFHYSLLTLPPQLYPKPDPRPTPPSDRTHAAGVPHKSLCLSVPVRVSPCPSPQLKTTDQQLKISFARRSAAGGPDQNSPGPKKPCRAIASAKADRSERARPVLIHSQSPRDSREAPSTAQIPIIP